MSCPDRPPADINDIFDQIFLCEESLSREAHNQAYAKVLSEGNAEAYHLGYHRASQIAAELGYFKGVVERHSSLIEENQYSARICKILQSLTEAIDNFPRTNDVEFDIETNFREIKSKFKQLCNLAKIPYNPIIQNLNF